MEAKALGLHQRPSGAKSSGASCTRVSEMVFHPFKSLIKSSYFVIIFNYWSAASCMHILLCFVLCAIASSFLRYFIYFIRLALLHGGGACELLQFCNRDQTAFNSMKTICVFAFSRDLSLSLSLSFCPWLFAPSKLFQQNSRHFCGWIAAVEPSTSVLVWDGEQGTG